jgi:hypothetical protein|nr:MAG TPA: hypothetical protein [Caudoviricetes sp.]
MEYLIIDPSTRKITIPKSEQLFGVYGEGNIERKHFKCPKIVGDNVDLSDCYIFVNYYTAKGLPGKYTVKDVKVDGENITFSWELKQHIFDANEDTSIYFAVEAKNKDKVEVFRTSPATGKTKETIDTDTEIEDTYADVILDLISRVDTLEKEPISEEKIEKSVKSYLEKNPIEETDPTVPEWAKAEEKPTYTAEEVGALPDTTKIPKNLSNLQDDAEHRTVTDTEKQSWNNKSNFSGNYEDLQGKPTIPTVPTKLPNPQSLTITYGGKEYTYDGSEAITITIETGGIERIEKLSTDTAVTLEPNKLYVFPEMESLTYTIGEGTGEVHFIFKSGATATRVVHPDGVNIGSFSVDVNKIYEVSILEGLLTSQNWSVSVGT